MKQLDQFINEAKFGYTWENAFICSIKSINDENKSKEIIKKWFNDDESARGLSTFLYRLGHEPKSNSPEDLYNAIAEVSMDNKYNLK